MYADAQLVRAGGRRPTLGGPGARCGAAPPPTLVYLLTPLTSQSQWRVHAPLHHAVRNACVPTPCPLRLWYGMVCTLCGGAALRGDRGGSG